MIRAILFIGLIVSTCLFFAGCGDERKLLYPYRGADYFAGTDDSEVKDTVLAFRIGTVRDVLQGHRALIPVMKIGGKERIYYTDLTIGYDSDVLSFMGATRGHLYDSPGDFEWEYFTYRFGPLPGCDSRCPAGQIKFVLMADQNDGPHQPLEYRIPDGTTLFTLDFLVSNDRTLECQFIPISFFWIDCGDNQVVYQDDTLDSYDPYQIGISRHVWDAAKRRIDFDNPFPSFTGAGSSCDTINDGRYPVRQYVDFFNGGVQIICADTIDTRGDINLNGIPYEIGDAVVFVNYFIQGLDAFNVTDALTAASDINGNGIPFELADLVHLIRIIVGDAIPAPLPIYEPLFVAVDSNKISISAPHPVGAFYIVLEGEVSVSLAPNTADLELKSGFSNSQTRVLLYSFEQNMTIPNGEILHFGSAIKIIDSEAASYYGADFKNIIIGKPDDTLKGDSLNVMANPNPFSDSTTIAFTPSDTYGWRLQIYATSGLKVWEYDSPAGPSISHTVWKPENLPAGIYHARITAGSKTGRLRIVYNPD